jgi:hypothetical protein
LEDDWDDADGYHNYPNDGSLLEAQRNFIDFRATTDIFRFS